MQSLEQLLSKLEAKYGVGGENTQWLRDQIAAGAKKKTTQEMYITGMIQRNTGNKQQ
jgi:hypothetical protein